MSGSLPSAKGYYYKEVAPEEQGLSYQQAHQLEKPLDSNDGEWTKLAEFQPKRSNDILIESYIDELIEAASGEIKSRLDRVFVVKRRNFKANAGAVHSKGRFTGELVTFNVGLSDACFQYAIAFAEFIELCRLRHELGDSDHNTKVAFVRLCSDITKLAEAQLTWAVLGNNIRLKKKEVLWPEKNVADAATGVACTMDKYILRHELAHHLLSHTDYDDKRDAGLSALVEKWGVIGKASKEHQSEFEADVGSVYLAICNGKPPTTDGIVNIALGSLLGITVLGQLKADIHASSFSHPSTAERFLLMQSVLRSLAADDPHFRSLESDIYRFQALLFGVQKRGLGQLHTYLLEQIDKNNNQN
jgi:hypothetical protein